MTTQPNIGFSRSSANGPAARPEAPDVRNQVSIRCEFFALRSGLRFGLRSVRASRPHHNLHSSQLVRRQVQLHGIALDRQVDDRLAQKVDLPRPGRVAEQPQTTPRRLAAGFEEMEDQAPAAVVRGLLGELDVGHRDGLAVDLRQPSGRADRRRPGVDRDDQAGVTVSWAA